MLSNARNAAQRRNDVNEYRSFGGRLMPFAHSCCRGQEMWRHGMLTFADYPSVVFDRVGAGRSHLVVPGRSKYDCGHSGSGGSPGQDAVVEVTC